MGAAALASAASSVVLRSRRLRAVEILHLNWRKEALYVALVAAEMCWFTPWAFVVTRQVVTFSPYVTALLLGTIVLAVMYFRRILNRLQIDLPYQRVVLIGTVLIAIPLIIHVFLYPGYGWLDLGWLGKAGKLFITFYSLPTEVIISAMLLYLWWRGVSIGQRSLNFQGVAFSFRLGVLLIAFSIPWLPTYGAYDLAPFVVFFFFFGLMAVALARVEEVNRAKEGAGVPFNLAWLAILLGSTAAVLMIAWLIFRIYSVESFSRMLRWLWPIFAPLLQVILHFILLVLKFLSPALLWLFRIFQEIAGVFAKNVEVLEKFESLVSDAFSRTEPVVQPSWLVDALRYTCLGVIGAGILVSLALALRQRPDRQQQGDEIRESLWSSEAFAQGAMSSLRQGWGRFRQLAGRRAWLGPGMRLYAAVSIRKIYANMTRLAARQGFPRQLAQTPYEYLPTLGLAFPACQAEAIAITEAYVKVRYGEVPESIEDLQRIREYWQKIQASYSSIKPKKGR